MNNALHPELLSPAGSLDSGWAALSYGADALYTGLQRFSARAEAANLSEQELDELIGYAHANSKKVYITFNTLVQQHELPKALEVLAMIHDLNADGIIVQDMGVARMARRFFPSLDLHASTQLAVHNLSGAKLLADLGFTRVVLARELSLKEIETITRNCSIETEVFIHGALCYSYSGLCLFSSHLNGRSGNRGRCAYCCRQTFDTDAGKSLPFAMKDFSIGPHLDELLDAGVASLKIEGRMKSPTYVAAVTDFYRKRLNHQIDGTKQKQLLADIQTIFGRASTDLYLKNADTHPIDPTTNGHRGAVIGTIQSIRPEFGGHWMGVKTNRVLQRHDGLKIERPGAPAPFAFFAKEIRLRDDRSKKLKFEVPADAEIEVRLPDNHPFLEPGMTVYCSASQEVRQRYDFEAPRPGTFKQQNPFSATVELTANGITARSEQIENQIEEPLSEARNPEKTVAAIRKSFDKTGDTEWKLDQLEIIDNGLFAPASILNEARRQLLEKLSAALAEQKTAAHAERLMELVVSPSPPSNVEQWSIKLRDRALLNELTEEELSRFEIIDDIPVIQRKSLITPHDSLVTPHDSLVTPHDSLVTPHSSPIEVANVGALYPFRDAAKLTADWPLYTLNSEAAAQWQELGIQQMVLSPEDTGENMKALLGILGDRAIVPVYQHTPLMISATRPESGDTLHLCREQPMHIEKEGDQFVLIHEAPFSLVDHLDELRAAGARNFRIDLTYGVHSSAEAAKVIRKALCREPIANSYDGNFSRTL